MVSINAIKLPGLSKPLWHTVYGNCFIFLKFVTALKADEPTV